MVTKTVLLLCAQAILAQCIPNPYPCSGYNENIGDGLSRPFAVPRNAYIAEAAMAAGPYAAGPYAASPYAAGPYAAGPFAADPYTTDLYAASPLAPERPVFRPTNGGSFAITSVSPMAVTGITMISENAYEGSIAVSGSVPFLGAAALEGSLPTAGTGVVSYGCGNGNVGIVSEDTSASRGPYGYTGVSGDLGYGYAPQAYEIGTGGPRSGYGYNRGCDGALY